MKLIAVDDPSSADVEFPPDGGEIIIRYGNKMSLLHELGHAIEVITTGGTSEQGAWVIARSLMKPEEWDDMFFLWCAKTYLQVDPYLFFRRKRPAGIWGTKWKERKGGEKDGDTQDEARL
jgi:hypothetical protein